MACTILEAVAENPLPFVVNLNHPSQRRAEERLKDSKKGNVVDVRALAEYG
jgi:hypothetical protein